ASVSWNITSGDMAALPLFQKTQATAFTRLEPIVNLCPKRSEVSDGRNYGEEHYEVQHDHAKRVEGGILTATRHSQNQKSYCGNLGGHLDLAELRRIDREALR